MSNEELVLRIQAGEKDLLCDLWCQIEKWVRYKANKYYSMFQGRYAHLGVTSEDLYQSGFFALLKAAEAYDFSKGLMFITYLGYPLKNEFDRLAKRNNRICKQDALDGSLSLDAPVRSSLENEKSPLSDFIADPSSGTNIDKVISADCEKSLSEALQEAISALPERYQEVIKGRYYKGEKPASLMTKLGVSRMRVWAIQDSALKALSKTLADFREDFISREEYQGGYSAWLYSGMSLQERIVVRLDNYNLL